MPVASSLGAGLVAPDVAAHMREASAVAQLGDVPCRLARLMGTREPLEVVGTYDVIGHSRECRSCRLPAFTNVTEASCLDRVPRGSQARSAVVGFAHRGASGLSCSRRAFETLRGLDPAASIFPLLRLRRNLVDD